MSIEHSTRDLGRAGEAQSNRRSRHEEAESAVLAALGTLEAVDRKYGFPADTPQPVHLIRRKSGVSYDRANGALSRLAKDGRVLKSRRGWYVLPDGSPYKPRHAKAVLAMAITPPARDETHPHPHEHPDRP